MSEKEMWGTLMLLVAWAVSLHFAYWYGHFEGRYEESKRGGR